MLRTMRTIDFKPHSMNMKVLCSCAVTFHDLSTESSVNGGNTTAQHFNLNILSQFSCSATATIINSLMLIQLHITAQHFNVE